jgi:hypothetical protein
MANTERFKFNNVDNESVKKSKNWIKSNPHIARGKAEDCDKYEIEVFGYNHKKVANDLHKALEESGFLEKYGLFRIKVSPM